MKKKKIVYIGDEEKIIPQFGVFKPGEEVDYDESLLSTGLFGDKKAKSEKEGDE